MSRREHNRRGLVKAAPDARPEKPLQLTDENSTKDPYFPDIRYANQLNTRAYVTATSAEEPEPEPRGTRGARGE